MRKDEGSWRDSLQGISQLWAFLEKFTNDASRKCKVDDI